MLKNLIKHYIRMFVFSLYKRTHVYFTKTPKFILKYFESRSTSISMQLLWAQVFCDMGEKEVAINRFRSALSKKIPDGNNLDSIFIRSYFKLLMEKRDFPEILRILQHSFATSDQLAFVARDFITRATAEGDKEFLEQWALMKRRLIPEIDILTVTPVQEVAAEFKELFPAHDYTFQDPTIFEGPTTPATHTVSVPAQYMARITDCRIAGAFQVLKNEKFVLHEPAAHPKHGLVAGVWRNFCAFGGRTDQVVFFSRPTAERHISSGILFSGRATENFFHWLVEYTPKLLNIQAAQLPTNIPLIVKPGLPKQFYEALRLLTPQRELLFVDTNTEILHVDHLWVSSVHTYHPDDFSLPYWMGAAISTRHLQFVRDTIFKNLNLTTESKDSTAVSKKLRIYLSRGHARAVENNDEITNLLKGRGFDIVLPEKLTFEEQVRLFHQADIIVGATGAAFSNLLFVKPGAEIVTLVSERNATWCMKANLAKFAGARHTHVVGPHILPREKFRSEDGYVHSNFTIDVKKLDRLITEIENRGGKNP